MLTKEERALVFLPPLRALVTGGRAGGLHLWSSVGKRLAQRATLDDYFHFVDDLETDFEAFLLAHEGFPVLHAVPLSSSPLPSGLGESASAPVAVEDQEVPTGASPELPPVGSEPDASPTKGLSFPAPGLPPPVVGLFSAGLKNAPKEVGGGAEPSSLASEG